MVVTLLTIEFYFFIFLAYKYKRFQDAQILQEAYFQFDDIVHARHFPM